MKTRLLAWASWITFLVSAISEWGLDIDLPLTPALWLVLAAVVFFATNASAVLTTNSWTATDGKWEVGANWSAGTPVLSDSANRIGNNSTLNAAQTVTIDHSTEINNGTNSCMVISNLTLVGINASRTVGLLMTNFTLPNPLKIANTLTIGLHSSVVISNALLQIGGANAGTLSDDSGLTMFSGTISGTNSFTTFVIGDTGAGVMSVLGGTWQAGTVHVGTGRGTLTMAGGTNSMELLEIGTGGGGTGGTGMVWLTGGRLTTTNLLGVYIGSTGVGQMTVSNGTWQASGVEVGSLLGTQGTLTIAGGTNLFTAINVGENSGVTGTVWLTGGQLTVTNNIFDIGDSGVGQMTVSNGTWQAEYVSVGDFAGSQGTLTIAGGTNTFVGGIGPYFRLAKFGGSTGTVWLTGGQLTVTNSTSEIGDFGVGQMTVSNGAWQALDVSVGKNPGALGTLTVAGGTSVISSNLTVGDSGCSSTGFVWVVGGELRVTNAAVLSVLEVRSGTLTQSGGILAVDRFVMTNGCGHFVHTGGTFTYGTAVLDPAGDDDGDGLPNGWEHTFGLDPLSATGNDGASGDPDGDGYTNLQEYLAGTDPGNPGSVPLGPDSWIFAGSGQWVESNKWASAAPPLSGSSVFITNSTPKTVTINATTSGSFPLTMTVSNLTLSGLGTVTNTLSLSDAGTNLPLRILNSLTISNGASLVISNSALQVDGLAGGGFAVDGSVTNLAGGVIVATNFITRIGNATRGEFTTLPGSRWQAQYVFLGSQVGSQGTLTIAGGTNTLSGGLQVCLSNSSVATVWVKSGQLLVTNGYTFVGGGLSGSLGQITVSNGEWRAGGLYLGGGLGSQATLTIAGGTSFVATEIYAGYSPNAAGSIWITGGQLTAGYAVELGLGGPGQMTISNGVFQQVGNGGMDVGFDSVGTLTLAGGTTLLTALEVGGAATATGAVWITGGQHGSTNTVNYNIIGSLGVGQMTISNGTWAVNNVIVGNSAAARGALTVAGGKSLIYSNLVVGDSTFCNATDTVTVVGGELRVTNDLVTAVLEVKSGTLTQSGGVLDVDRLVVTNACARFTHTGGTLITGLVTPLPPGLDADGDGLPNGYEQANGLDPFSPVGKDGPDGDPDGDGVSNLNEMLAGTNPNDANSAFRITAVARQGNDINVTWTTAPGRTNRVLVCSGDGGGGFTNNFSNLSSLIIIPGIGGESTTNYVDVGGATAGSVRYYRVRLVP